MESELEGICKIINYEFKDKLCPELYSYGVKKWWWGKYAYPIIYTILWIMLKVRYFFRKNRNKKYDVAIAFAGHINDLTFISNNFIKSNKKMCWAHGALAEYLLICSGYLTLYRKIKNVCVLSNYAQDAAIYGNKFLKEIKINKIYNPIEINNKSNIDYEKVERLKNKYRDYILMVGRFTKQKDQATVVRALKILREEYKLNKYLVFVGDGEEKVNVEKLSNELGVSEFVIFEGARLDVQNYYSSAKVFVHSSPAEGFGMVILESMYYQTPVIATNSLPGIPEILENEKYGLICKVADENNMAYKINKLYEDNKLYEFYKAKGIKRLSDFSYEQIIPQLEEIIENLI